jgi:hypothetical protein
MMYNERRLSLTFTSKMYNEWRLSLAFMMYNEWSLILTWPPSFAL